MKMVIMSITSVIELFNNLDSEWDSETISYLILGDLLVHGFCVIKKQYDIYFKRNFKKCNKFILFNLFNTIGFVKRI